MNTKIRTLLSALLAFIMLVASVSSANASVFDWLKNGTGISASADNQNSSADSVSFDKIYQDIQGFKTQNSELQIQGNAVVATASPASSKKTAFKIKTANQISQTYTVMATGYSSTIDQTDSTPFITAAGTYVRDGIIAANFLPFGTRIKIPDIFGDKIFVVEDRMNSKYWMNVDVWFAERQQALNFGARKVKIEIVS